ncbi:polysaccharide biosynthesis tyrosine autokinase [Nibrella viscosa]|uniref:Polysaccharide biosynthesis tyrosine autokinase n=1 Tax=Nibrella viscosa TaxID=1084524 RepID=A0ABP8KUG5_9BACT
MSTNHYTYTPYQMEEVESTPSLKAVLVRYLKYWKWFVLSLILATAGAYVFLLYQQPVYKVQASLLVKDEKKGMNDQNILKELEIFAPSKVVENEIEVLRSNTLLGKVVDQLGLNVSYFQITMFGNREVYEDTPIRIIPEQPHSSLYDHDLDIAFIGSRSIVINGQPYPLNKSVNTPFGMLRIQPRRAFSDTTPDMVVRVSPRARTIRKYMENLKVEATGKASTVLMLTLEDAVPAKGEAILNNLIGEYNRAALEDKNLVAANTLKFIEERLQLISGELSTVEKDVEHYKASQGITDLSTQAQAFLQTVQQNDAQMNQVTIQLNALGDVEQYLDKKTGDRGVAPATLGLNDPVLLGLISKLTDLELQRDHLARTTSEVNPLLQSLDSQIKATRTSVTENVQTLKKMLTGTQQQLLATNQRLEGMIRTVPSKERTLLNITRQQAIKNNLYTYLLQKREETALSYASAVADSRTIDAASTDEEPIRPVRKLVFLLFGLLGLMLPVGAIAMRDALNDRVGRRSDIESVSQVPILGEIMQSRNPEQLVMVSNKRSVIAEQIRTLRTNLQFLRSTPGGSQVVLFTSSISGEGKSFLSLNLGASLALVDRPTVILEMDLRKPKLHAALKMPNYMGISNYLIQEATLDEVLQEIPGFPNYSIITCGPIPPNPAELLNSPQLERMLLELRERFDYIIVDSPPIGLVTDAQLIAPFADTTLFMVRHDHTPKNSLKMIDTLFREQRFQRLNVILNAVGEGESYYYSYGSYGNSYYENKK